MVTRGSTDHHTREQLLCAQQSVLFLWMLLHVSPGPVTLPRARKTNDQQHLGQRGRFKCNTCLSSLYILYENNQNMLFLTNAAWLVGPLLWSGLKYLNDMKFCTAIYKPERTNPSDLLVTLPLEPLWGWHLWFWVKCFNNYWISGPTCQGIEHSGCCTCSVWLCYCHWDHFRNCKQYCFLSHHQVKTTH